MKTTSDSRQNKVAHKSNPAIFFSARFQNVQRNSWKKKKVCNIFTNLKYANYQVIPHTQNVEVFL